MNHGGESKIDLIVRVKEIKGHCPVYKIGDTFSLKSGYKLVTEIPVCMHSLASSLPYYNALRVSEPREFGLAGKDDKTKAHVQCPNPTSYTDGGTVVFEISRVEKLERKRLNELTPESSVRPPICAAQGRMIE